MKRSFLKNAALLSAGSLIAKAIGALYRIPLLALVGGYGMGLYQMAYPLFCVALTFSSAGIPTALARTIARETARGAENPSTMRTAFRLFALLGLCGTGLMCLLARPMAAVQGEEGLALCYLSLAPAVLLVALIAVLRGYFQGKSEMLPTAASEIAEQLVKAGAGLLFLSVAPRSPAAAVAGALFAVTLSELCALALLLSRYRGRKHIVRLEARRTTGFSLLSAALPVMVSTSLLPLSQTADSVLIVRLLARHTPRAVALYGLYVGGAVSLVNLPVSVVYGLAAAAVPAVAAAHAEAGEGEAKRRAVDALGVTVALSLVAAAGLFFFAKTAVRILYPTLPAEDAATLSELVRLSSVSAVALAGVDTLAACLAGMGRANKAARAMGIAVAVKFLLQIFFINETFGIAGAAIAANGCYLIAFFLDLVYTVKKEKRRKDHDRCRRTRSREGRSQPQGEKSAGARG